METLGALGGELVFFALSVGLMQLALWRRRAGGLFSALNLGLIPAAVSAGVLFLQLQGGVPEMRQIHDVMVQRLDRKSVV